MSEPQTNWFHKPPPLPQQVEHTHTFRGLDKVQFWIGVLVSAEVVQVALEVVRVVRGLP